MGPPRDRKPRVILVDDYPAVLVALSGLIAPFCELVATASNGMDAVERALTLKPDVLVIDLMLPDIDGLEACRRVKQIEPGIAVVIITASDDPAVRSAAARDGAAGFVPKHLVAETLVETIESVFAQATRG